LGHSQHNTLQVSKTDLKILMLEDDPLDAELNREYLRLLEEYNCIVNWVTDKASYLHSLQSDTPDIILSDYNIPGYNGLEALNDLNARGIIVPFIVVTGTIDEETAAGTIKAGAWDYVVKDRLFRLPLAIRSALMLKEQKINAAISEAKIRQLSLAIEQSPVHVVISNTSHVIEYVNSRFTEVTGFSVSDVIGQNVAILFPKETRQEYYSDYLEQLGEKGVWRAEVLALRKDGSHFWENVSVAPIRNEDGQPTHYVAIKEDITSRKQMEQALIEARDSAERSDRLKDAFLQNLSHEIRTPLNAIVGFSELLSLREISAEEQKEYISIILGSSNQLLSIVNDVLTAARIQTGQEVVAIRELDVNAMLDNLYGIFQPLARSKALELLLVRPEMPVRALTDETKVTQVISNLLNNALKFTHKGRIEFGYAISGQAIEFFVRDTGIGIAPEHHEIIFDRFRQVDVSNSRSYGGTGLGLSISKAFADMLKGSIRLESEIDKGSTFYFSIPYILPEANAYNINPPMPHAPAGLKILVAEDELYNYMLIQAYLEGMGIALLHASNGIEAIEMCKATPDLSMVLMDIKMPRMDGIAALSEIRKFNPHVPVIAQTAFALESERQYLLEKGFDDYLAKPIKIDELKGIIARHSKV